MASRKLFKDKDRKVLLEANSKECANLVERWTHPNLPNHLVEYMMKVKSKSKL